MITAQHISKWYGRSEVKAVCDVSFEVPAGQIVGLLGPNGAGKTTTLRMITGYLPPSLGTITVAGHDTITESMQARRALGYLPEAAPLYPEMRVADYLKYRAKLYGMAARDRRPAMVRAMERCWLLPVARRRIGQLSKGFKQRVGLAGAMLHDPQVLILDEPTSGLDPTQIRETRTLIRELAHKRTVVVSSHILPEVEKTCDRVLIIARGALRADGAPEALLEPLRDVSPYFVEVCTGALGSEGDGTSAARQALAALPGVQSIELGSIDPAWTWIRVIPKAGEPDLREAIARAIANRHAGGPDRHTLLVREIRRESPTLEQLFFRIIEEDRVEIRSAEHFSINTV